MHKSLSVWSTRIGTPEVEGAVNEKVARNEWDIQSTSGPWGAGPSLCLTTLRALELGREWNYLMKNGQACRMHKIHVAQTTGLYPSIRVRNLGMCMKKITYAEYTCGETIQGSLTPYLLHTNGLGADASRCHLTRKRQGATNIWTTPITQITTWKASQPPKTSKRHS